MARYAINKGIDKSVEFKGLRAQYLLHLFGGLGAVFMIVVAMFIIGLNPYVTTVLALILGSAVISIVYKLNHKYGKHGLTKIFARMSRPKYIIVRSGIANVFKKKAAKQIHGNKLNK